MGHAMSEKVIEIVCTPRVDGKLFRDQGKYCIYYIKLIKKFSTNYHILKTNPEMATVIEGICGDGTALDPMIIYKAEKFVYEWFEDIENVPEGFLFGRLPNGWTDERIAMHYLERNFGENSLSTSKVGEEFRLLIFDGHNSHVNMHFLNYCISHRIIPLCLPPHTMHRLQPLDVSLFSPYKKYYSQELQKRFQRRIQGIAKGNFYSILQVAQKSTFTQANIYSSF